MIEKNDRSESVRGEIIKQYLICNSKQNIKTTYYDDVQYYP